MLREVSSTPHQAHALLLNAPESSSKVLDRTDSIESLIDMGQLSDK